MKTHKRLFTVVALLALALVAAGCTAPLAPIQPDAAGAAAAPAAVSQTEVITFEPGAPAGDAQEGSCWTNSLAVWRTEAWRCMVGNNIFDPCFAGGDEVICGADPITDTPGFLLNLTESLPASDLSAEAQAAENHAWMAELADGTICGFATGATAGVDGERINYLCASDDPSQMVGLVGELTPGPVWQAKKVLLGQGGQGAGPIALETTTVDVRTVWR